MIAVGVAYGRAQTTASQTIADRDGDNRLEPGPRDDYEVRTELGGAPSPDRFRTRVPRLFFGQLTDMHVVDEESPLRVEFLDRVGPPFTSAYRPQEGISAQVLNEMVRQMRNTVSPVTHDPVELVMTTGDNSDNTQLNETRWFIDLLDGGGTDGSGLGRAGAGLRGHARLEVRRRARERRVLRARLERHAARGQRGRPRLLARPRRELRRGPARQLGA